MSETTSRRRITGRSPNYPAISLEKALARASELYRKGKRHRVPAESVPELWGYKSLNGPASQTVSALLQFGLIEDEGTKAQRVLRVTDLAQDILEHPDRDQRAAALKKAALNPRIHLELWQEHGADQPPEASLRWTLARERGFTETGARELAREWAETLAFAGLDEDDTSPTQGEPAGDELEALDHAGIDTPQSGEAASTVVAGPAVARGRAFVAQHAQDRVPSEFSGSGTLAGADVQSYPIPIALSGRPPVVITGAFPLSEQEWIQFSAVLTAMKPVLVGNPKPATPPASDASASDGSEEDLG